MSTANTLPHWDMTVIYPGLDSPEFDQGFAEFAQQIADLVQLFDTQHIHAQTNSSVTASTIQAFELVTTSYNAALEKATTLRAYLSCFVTTNTQDTLAQSHSGEFQQIAMKLPLLNTRYAAWIGSLNVDELIARSELAREHHYMLQKAGFQAKHLLPPTEEDLAAELTLSSGNGWEKLYSDITSRIQVSLDLAGQPQTLPMSMVRNLAFDTDRSVRHQAYQAELTAWSQHEVPLAAAFNGIKGQVNTLSRRRGWSSPLAASLFSANIDQETLEAMLTAAREALPDFRRYLQAKARALDLERLAWFDIFAPVGQAHKTWDFEDARQFIVEKFGAFSPRLSDFAARAFRENWIDAEPRLGKVDGAYCTPLRKDESRVFANFKPSFDGVSVLAHELGHGYHNLNLALRTELQKNTPMTLAETASIFCETIIVHAALNRADQQEQITILENSIQSSCQVVVDILSRFLFESRTFERRKQRDLSVDELKALMLDAQKETYGDGLDESQLHPYMWAVKPHYYRTRLSFYNYPYMFGLLFGLGLYARYQQDTDAFKVGYDDLLASTGLDNAATLASRFSIDIRSIDFWRSSLDIVRKDIDRFERLIQ